VTVEEEEEDSEVEEEETEEDLPENITNLWDLQEPKRNSITIQMMNK
jgi:hypothetical protein